MVISGGLKPGVNVRNRSTMAPRIAALVRHSCSPVFVVAKNKLRLSLIKRNEPPVQWAPVLGIAPTAIPRLVTFLCRTYEHMYRLVTLTLDMNCEVQKYK